MHKRKGLYSVRKWEGRERKWDSREASKGVDRSHTSTRAQFGVFTMDGWLTK